MDTEISKEKVFQWKHVLPLIVWMAVIFSLSSIPGELLPHTEISFADKMAHVAVYAILAFFSFRTATYYAPVTAVSRISAYLMSVGMCVAYGASDELHQLFVHGRTCDFLDFCVDAASVLTVHAILYYDSRKMKDVSVK